MSSKAITWAWDQQIKPATSKLILMAMAECANHETALCYPSIAALEHMTGLDRKTIPSAVAKLVTDGLLVDTGKTTGRTNQIKVYRFTFETGPKSDSSETGPKFPGTGPISDIEQARKRATEPSNRNLEEQDSPLSLTGEATPTEKDLFGGGSNLPMVIEPPIEEYVLSEWAKLKAEHPGITGLKILSKARVARIHARTNEVVKASKGTLTGRQVWDVIFAGIRASPFMLGKGAIGQGYTKPFSVYLDYILRQQEFFKLIEGHDDNGQIPDNDQFDPATGRRFGSAELAARRVLARIKRAQERGAG